MKKASILKLSDDLLDAVIEGKLDAVRKLLAQGADVNRQNHKFSGNSGLHYACQAELPNKKMVALLLRSKATVNLRNNEGNTPLHLLIDCSLQRSKQAASRDLFTRCNSESGWKRWKELTAAKPQLDKQFIEVARLLLKAGAGHSIENDSGMTPLDMAQSEDNVMMIELLKSFGVSSSTRKKRAVTPKTNPLTSLGMKPGEIFFQLDHEDEIRFSCDKRGLVRAYFTFGYTEEELRKSLTSFNIQVRYKTSERTAWKTMRVKGVKDNYWLELVGPILPKGKRSFFCRIESALRKPIDLGKVSFKR